MQHHVFVLKLMVICLLQQTHANDSEIAVDHHGHAEQEQQHLHFTASSTVLHAEDSVEGMDEEPLLTSAPLLDDPTEEDLYSDDSDDSYSSDMLGAAHPEPTDIADNLVLDHEDDGAGEHLPAGASAAIPEPHVDSGNNKTDGRQEAPSLADETEPVGIDSSSGGATSTASGLGNHLADDDGGKDSEDTHANKTETDLEHRHDGAKAMDNELVDHAEEKDTPAAIVESEGMFTVKVRQPVAMEQTMEEPMYSGDGPLEPQNLTAWLNYPAVSSGDDQIESQVSSGEAELTASPMIKNVADPRSMEEPFKIPEESKHEKTGSHPPRRLFGGHRQRCEDLACGDHHLKVSTSTAGGLVIPAGVMLTVRCSAQSLPNDTAVIKWHLPPRKALDANQTMDGDKHPDVERRINITEEVLELPNKRVVVSIIKVVNVTEEDAGMYVCAAKLTHECCQRNHTVGIRIYVPPSYAVDFAIVGAVCFVEFLVILYFKTRSDRQGRPKESVSRADNGYKADYQPLPLEPKSKELQIEEEEQQRLA